MTRADRRGAAQLRQSLALYGRLGGYIRACWHLVALAMAAMLASTALTLAKPWPMQVIIDSVLGATPAPAWITVVFGDLETGALLTVATGVMVVAVVTGQLLAVAQGYTSELLGQRMVLRLRCDLFAKLQRLSLRFHDHASVGDLIHRITGDAAALQDIVTYGFVPLAIQLITAAAIAATVFALEPRLGLVALSIVPILLLWTIWSSERLRRRARRLAHAESGLYTTASEVLGAMRAVKSFAMEEAEIARFTRHARSSQEAYVRVMTFSTLGGQVTEGLAGIATAAVVFLGAWTVLDGALSVGELLVFVAYVGALYGPVTQIAASGLVIQRSAASIERVAQILDEEEEHRRSATRLPRVEGHIRYEGVRAGYGEDRAVLESIDLDIPPGERVAVVGRSGTGKTTLVSLMLRFYRPQRGRILLDGVDIEELDLTWLRRQIALVLQEPIIFSGSIRENIAYGRPDAAEADILAASAAAGLHDFVSGLPQGYDTQVGERGIRLSGGQRQRLSIARAFLKDAPIVILDEPTASLDATTEQQVFASLDRLARGRTTLVISHRLATARRADRIVVLAGGRIVEQGRHDALLAAGGAYARLYRDQAPVAPEEHAVSPP